MQKDIITVRPTVGLSVAEGKTKKRTITTYYWWIGYWAWSDEHLHLCCL